MFKEKLLTLARNAIEYYLEGKSFEPDEKIKKEFSEKRACFVTLTLDGNLRGCIGCLEAKQELWKDVIENAVNSAFNDPRFYPLNKEEFDKIKIEISILSKPEKINYNSEKELLEKISEKGVIIQKGFYSATYLPQVWEQIKNKEEFLSSLCLKAGLNENFWKNNKLDVWIYEVEKITE